MPTKEQLHEEGEVGVPGRERQRRPGGEGQVAAHQRAGVGQREHAEVEQRHGAVAVHDVRHGVVPRRERQHRRLAPALQAQARVPAVGLGGRQRRGVAGAPAAVVDPERVPDVHGMSAPVGWAR